MTSSTNPGQVWYCPACGTRLSYGVYCKTCEAEPGWEIRPATEAELLAARIRAIPAPEYPRFQDDYA